MAKIDDEVKTKFQNDKQRFITNLVFTANWFRNKVTEFLKPYGVSFQQFNILRILRGAKDWRTMNEVKTLMVDKSPNTTRLTDKLFEKGLIKRKRSEQDRRVVYVAITEKGLDLLTTLDEADHSSYLGFMNRMTNEEAKLASDAIDKVRDD